MAGRKPGGPKYGGRQKGTPNKRSWSAIEICEKNGYDPIQELITISKETGSRDLKASIAKEVAKYVYPQRKALEHSGEIANPFSEKTTEELKELVKEAIND
jgi:tyrosyl-tRNA synthetase